MILEMSPNVLFATVSVASFIIMVLALLGNNDYQSVESMVLILAPSIACLLFVSFVLKKYLKRGEM